MTQHNHCEEVVHKSLMRLAVALGRCPVASSLVSVPKCVLSLNLWRIAQEYSSKTEPTLCPNRDSL